MKDIENLKNLVKESVSISEVMIKLGYTCKGGGSFTKLKEVIKSNSIDITHFKGKSHGKTRFIKREDQDVFIKNSKYLNNRSLKTRLIKDFGFKEECCLCGIIDWLGKPLSLQLDHINGVNKDNRISNLRFLCPNCHSQTDTFSGKNIKK